MFWKIKKIEISYNNYKRQGAILRAKLFNFEEQEANISYVSKIEKLRGDLNTISCLFNKDGLLKEGTENVLDIAYDFYSDLYTKEQEDLLQQTFFFQNITNKLSVVDRDYLDLPLSDEEFLNSLKDLQNNKTPGDDSLTKEFYVCFWEEIHPIYSRVITEIIRTGELSPSQKRGLITIVYKKNDRSLIKNYRPISLLNVDLKILTRSLAKRLATKIANLIHCNQKCIPGRKILLNVHILQDLIDYINNNKTRGAILFLDQEKAFDRMSHSFIIQTLQHFGFGSKFINWISTIYNGCSARVKINGFTTPTFSIQRGVRQGCPLSSLLYVLCAEVLCLEIRRNREIVGFTYANSEHKDLEYADDLSIFVSTIESISQIFKTLTRFEKASNAKINIDKTDALWLGSWRDNVHNPNNLKWTNSMVKTLGVYVGNNRLEAAQRGFTEIKEKISHKLKYWSGKGISLKGRIRVINTFVLSKLWYICEVQDIPNAILLDINKMLLKFVWNGKFHQRSLKGIQQDYKLGGLRLGCIEKKITAFRIQWLSYLLESDTNKIENFLANKLISNNNLKLGFDILKGYLCQHIKTIKHAFYRNSCITWYNANIIFYPKNILSIGHLCIYDNILLKDDDGRVFKPPNNAGFFRARINIPHKFGDLPFYNDNLNNEERQICLSVNRAFNRISWSAYDSFIKAINGKNKYIKKLTFSEIYWSLVNMDAVNLPWVTKWDAILNSNLQNWSIVWENVHNSMFSFKLQSRLWEMVNLNYITSYLLNQMYNIPNVCSQCSLPEEGPAHTILFCQLSSLVYTYFEVIAKRLFNKNLTIQEKAFGILHENKRLSIGESLRNYIIANIKYILFTKRARILNGSLRTKSNILITECKKYIASDLSEQFLHAKKNDNLDAFSRKFLLNNILGYIDTNGELIIDL